ncbi:GGDEF domain-containing protein [Rhizobium sp. G187]|uniref:GGDEF domain-containing protein n=1 Tax=Rhizobium sp. G187 TaxID=3451352 RepID=UPI003EE71F36
MTSDRKRRRKWYHSIVARIFMISFVCIHLPLIALLITFQSVSEPGGTALVLAVLFATLVGTLSCIGGMWLLTAPLRKLAAVITTYRINGSFADEMLDKRGDDEIAVVTRAVCGMVGEITALAERVEGKAALDPLTGLLNGSAAYSVQVDRLTRLSGSAAPVTVVVFELEEMDVVKNIHGRETGDLALVAVGDIVRQLLQERHIAARMSGKTFVLLFPGDMPAEVLSICERIRLAVDRLEVGPLERGDMRVTFGLSVRGPGDAIADLIHKADMALFRAKDTNRTGLEALEV